MKVHRAFIVNEHGTGYRVSCPVCNKNTVVAVYQDAKNLCISHRSSGDRNDFISWADRPIG